MFIWKKSGVFFLRRLNKSVRLLYFILYSQDSLPTHTRYPKEHIALIKQSFPTYSYPKTNTFIGFWDFCSDSENS